MSKQGIDNRRYLLAVILGAVSGGIVVALATKAIPRIMYRMMSQMMSEMPQKMMAQMKTKGLDPAEMCQRTMANFNPPRSGETPTE
jgi:hypothetical protein